MNKSTVLFLIIIAAAITFVLAPFVGMETIPFESVFKPESESVKAYIFWKLRIPRIITSFCAGAARAISGMTFQALFRNPLATPFTLGVSSGAAFGAAIYIKVGFLFSILGLSLISFIC